MKKKFMHQNIPINSAHEPLWIILQLNTHPPLNEKLITLAFKGLLNFYSQI